MVYEKQGNIPSIQIPEWPEAVNLMPISDKEFNRIRKVVYTRLGINLTEQKRSLVVGRLQKTVRHKGFSAFAPYCDYLESDKSGHALHELANLISTNHTFFYREKEHFEFLSNHVLPELVAAHNKAKSKDLRIWCAGCSSGEEPYTIIMLMLEFFGSQYKQWDAGILATDISEKAIRTAIENSYPPEKLAMLPKKLKSKYFKKTKTSNFSVIEAVKKEVTYRRFNLINPIFPFKKRFDIIFCRNVMIYFDKPTRVDLVNRFFNATVPGGYLFIGHSESLQRETCRYRYVMPAVYRKEEGL